MGLGDSTIERLRRLRRADNLAVVAICQLLQVEQGDHRVDKGDVAGGEYGVDSAWMLGVGRLVAAGIKEVGVCQALADDAEGVDGRRVVAAGAISVRALPLSVVEPHGIIAIRVTDVRRA